MSQAERPNTIRYGSRYPSTGPPAVARACPVCGGTLPSSRSVYCKTACKQLAYRLRHQPLATADPVILRKQLQRQRLLVAHTVYECSSCGERFLGERRCPDCHLYGRSVGLGGSCPDCETIILLADLLGPEVTTIS
jgi:ribosomal protein L32